MRIFVKSHTLIKFGTFAAVAALLSGGVSAADTKKSAWTGDIDVNALFTSGNSSQTSFGSNGKTTYKKGALAHTVSAFVDFNKSNGITDRERYGGAYNLAYDFSKRMFFSFDTSYESNSFGAFRERITLAAGAGYRFKDTDALKWTLEAAPSMLFTKNEDGSDLVSDFSAFARSSVTWQFTDTAKFTNITSAYFGGRSIVELKSAVEFKITKSISSKMSYDILYDRDAPIDRKTTDTIARVGLSYGF